VGIGQVGAAWRPALDLVWAFLRQNPGLRSHGHNIFLYHHPAKAESTMAVDFGVEVTRAFPQSAEVFAIETPAGRVASALHVGPYERMREAHEAIHSWARANHTTLGDKSWEIYGDSTDDPSQLETLIEYLLA
jgi:effector-binding domain-containing protein